MRCGKQRNVVSRCEIAPPVILPPASRPWTAALHLRNDPDLPDVFEYACHEGNDAMRNILSAARAAEAGR